MTKACSSAVQQAASDEPETVAAISVSLKPTLPANSAT